MKQLKITKQVTNRETAALDKYLQEIGKVQLLTPDEEVELTKKIKCGDNDALEKLTTANLRFVVSVAKQYQNQGLSLSDLISEGNIGLIKAAQRFDEQRGFKFISYAVWWIRQTILLSLAEHARIVRLPGNKIAHISKINKAFSELSQKFERAPTNEEIALALNISTEDIIDTMRSAVMHVSMDAPVSADDDSTMLDLIAGEEGDHTSETTFNNSSLLAELERALVTLAPMEANVIRLYFGLGEPAMTLEEIGEHFEITRERVRQIKEKAMSRLKHTSRSNILKTYLEE